MVGCHANIHTQNLETATAMSFNQNITAILPEEVGYSHVCTKSGRVAHIIYTKPKSRSKALTALLAEKVC